MSQTIDWNAVGAIATAVATITALVFGFGDKIAAALARGHRKASTATALIHSVQTAQNLCNAIDALLEPRNLVGHRQRVTEIGAVLFVPQMAQLNDRSSQLDVFGRDCAAWHGYAVALIQDLNAFSAWLSKIPPPNDAQWNQLTEQFGYQRECANQAAAALKRVEAYIKPYVPAAVMELRFGPNPNQQATTS